MTALQDIGKKLINLSATQLAKMTTIPDVLLKEIHVAHTLKTHEAKRRHLQYVGKIMREIDATAIIQELAQIQLTNFNKTKQFHEVEKWRDELIATGDDGLQKFMSTYPQADRQCIRQLIRKAQQDKAKQIDTGADTALFRYLRTLIEE